MQPDERVEDIQLPADVKERLMFVRTMNINERFANFPKQSESGRRAVNELTVRPRGSEGALEDELVLFARLQAVFFEERRQRHRGNIKYGFDRTGVGARANESAVGALA